MHRPLSYEKTPSGGVIFRELMVGGFTMGETDPDLGEREGIRAGRFLSMNALAAIPDLSDFLEDPEHTGALTGGVSFAPLATEIAADTGQFKLFVRAREPRAKAMVYSMTFRANAHEYCLRGLKQVPHRSIFHSWKDTTTLFCRLHEGSNDSGPVVGAGILHLTPLEFARQLVSFRTVNAKSVSAKTRALAGFGAFFARELIDTYLG
jgi:hypothetical protein